MTQVTYGILVPEEPGYGRSLNAGLRGHLHRSDFGVADQEEDYGTKYFGGLLTGQEVEDMKSRHAGWMGAGIVVPRAG